MKDFKRQAQTALYSTLSALKINNQNIPVYDKMGVPDNTSFPYIIIGDWTATDNSTDSTKGYEATITLTIVDRFNGNMGTRGNIYDVSDKILGAVKNSIFDNLQSFYVNCTQFDGFFEFPKTQTDTHLTVSNQIRYRFFINQKES